MAITVVSSTATPESASRRVWLGLAVLALPCLLVSMDLTVLNLALPTLAADLAPSSAQLLWIVDIYGFMVAGSLITMGTLGDRVGRRRLLLIGAAAFGLTSVAAAFAPSAAMLIAARALLGVAGATLAPSTLSLIRAMFHDPQQRAIAIGVWVMSFSAGGALGPLVGGLLLEQFWWGAVFLLAVPVMALLLLLGPVLLPEARDPQPGTLDPLSAALSLAAVLCVVWGLKHAAADGLGWLPLLCTTVGLGVGVLFVRRQGHLAHPLIDLRLFREPLISMALAINTLGLAVAYGGSLIIPQYLQLVRELSPLQAGLWMVPAPVGFMFGSLLAPWLARRVRVASLISGGLVLAALGFAMLSASAVTAALLVLAIGSFVYSLGLAPVVTLTTDLIVGAAPPERAGASAALAETSAEFGGALGIALLGSVAAAVYRSHMAADLGVALTPEALERVQRTFSDEVAIAGSLPDQSGAALLEATRAAFIAGFHLTTWVSAALAATLAVVAAALLRSRMQSGT